MSVGLSSDVSLDTPAGADERNIVHIVLIGQSGSGKTALAKELELRLNLPRISSGDIARELAESDAATDLALRQGAYAPEQAMRVRIHQEIEAAELARGAWILDGFPRMLEQLICLNQWTANMPMFFYLDTQLMTCIHRLTDRNRPGDNPDAIARKFTSFAEKTQPMIDVLEDAGILHTLYCSDWTIDMTVEAVESYLSE